GLNSGYMIWQYTAAALCNENKILSHPASADSIPTSGYQEDHVSMGANGVRKLKQIYENIVSLIAIEAMLGCVALHFRKPLISSTEIEKFCDKIKIKVTFDRFFGEDFERVRNVIIKEVLL
ncbi:MAG: aromatic amino acid lyase, partial [Fervidobacterium sp.]